jgi:hypothetical protein
MYQVRLRRTRSIFRFNSTSTSTCSCSRLLLKTDVVTSWLNTHLPPSPEALISRLCIRYGFGGRGPHSCSILTLLLYTHLPPSPEALISRLCTRYGFGGRSPYSGLIQPRLQLQLQHALYSHSCSILLHFSV